MKYLLAAKLRSFLTILGIVIGVASVIIIMAVGQSAQVLILDQVSSVGSNLIGVLPGASDKDGPPPAAMGIIITTLKYDDLLALTNGKNVPEVAAGSGYVLGTQVVKYEGEEQALSITGTTSGYIEVENTKLEEGRFITKEEEANLAKVAVVGKNVVGDLFNGENPIGKKIKIKDQNFSVIGILEKRGSSGFGISSQDDSIYVPLKTAQKLLLGIDHLGFMRLKARNADEVESAISGVKTTLRERHNIDDPEDDDFSVRNQASALDLIRKITDILRYFLLTIGTISLLVGGVGIMNIMLIAVSQRIREVGLRKAVGAKNANIQNQFLIESTFVAFLGGLIGIITGIILAFLISRVAILFGYNWPFLISWESVVIAAMVSGSVGIVFGLYPARKASRISPMEALRYE